MRDFIKDFPKASIVLGIAVLTIIYVGKNLLNFGSFFSGIVVGCLGAIGVILFFGGIYFFWLNKHIKKK